MKFKVVGKRLILTDCSHEITEGESLFDAVEITVPRYHDNCDLSELSFRFSEISEDGKTSAAQVLSQEKCDENYVYLRGEITAYFSAITGKVIFMLTGINNENITAKFQSVSYTINDDISLMSLPDHTASEQFFNQTQLEVQKAMEAAERAEKASHTPAPAEIYPATETNLGGVKVDGKTITVSEDGTISASENENLKSEIENVKSIIMPAAQPNNFLIYDDAGKPSVMVAISKFYLDDVISGASHTVHPAFIINGIEQEVIYISKYQNIVDNGKAYSLPMKTPQTNINFNTAYNCCKAKGIGWHLMTNAEWAAIALWCRKNGTIPKGNNNRGKDISETNLPQKAIVSTRDNQNRPNKILTGSGRENWFHDASSAGISDLNGNSWEWSSGLRLVDGEIQVLADNNAADQNNSVSDTSVLWRAIMPDGSLTAPGTSGTLKYDWKSNKCTVSTAITNKSTTDRSNTFESLTADGDVNVPEIMKYLALFPADLSAYDGDYFYMINLGEHIPVRGGDWVSGTRAGLFSLAIDYARASTGSSLSFRCAYYEAKN